MRFSVLLALSSICVASAPRTTAAQSAIDPNANVVELRTSCAMPGSTYLDNCFETTADLTDWLWDGGRLSEPNSLDEVTVRVGPGEFDRFECDSPEGMRGFVSVVGSGRDVTSFVSDSLFSDPTLEFTCAGGVTARGCTGLSFSDLTARGFGTGAIWTGDGTSFWEDADLIADNEGSPVCFGTAMAWYDVSSFDSVHFFWDTRFVARGAGTFIIAAFNGRGESWIYGSDLLVEAGGPGGGGSFYAGVFSGSSKADGIRLFGSTVRVKAVGSFSGMLAGLHGRGLSVANPEGRGTIHMHGGIVNVTGPFAVSVLTTLNGAFVHTPGTAFVLPGSGFNARILNLGASTINSPFLWPSGTQAPNIISQDGSDLFVKTDEGSGQNESHLFVYDSSCTGNTWRSVTTGNCL